MPLCSSKSFIYKHFTDIGLCLCGDRNKLATFSLFSVGDLSFVVDIDLASLSNGKRSQTLLTFSCIRFSFAPGALVSGTRGTNGREGQFDELVFSIVNLSVGQEHDCVSRNNINDGTNHLGSPGQLWWGVYMPDTSVGSFGIVFGESQGRNVSWRQQAHRPVRHSSESILEQLYGNISSRMMDTSNSASP